MVRLLIRTAICVATIAAAGGAYAADAELSTLAEGGSVRAEPSCRGADLGDAPFGLPDQGLGQSRRSVAGPLAGSKDLKLVFLCPARPAPQV